MTTQFSAIDYVQRLAKRLVVEFDDATQAGTPGLIGAAREHPARNSLEKLLPPTAAIGSGILIDSYGGQSRQQDIVVFEQANCPVYSINASPESTYYPCEGVIAVGEIKSRAGRKELEDAFEKIASAKRLKRYALREAGDLDQNSVPFRHYGGPVGIQGTRDEEFDQAHKESDQIYGFILCGEFALSRPTLIDALAKCWSAVPPEEGPNLIVSLKDGLVLPIKGNKYLSSPMNATAIGLMSNHDFAFTHLLRMLQQAVRHGRTVELKHLDRYLLGGGAGAVFNRIAEAPLHRS